MRLMDDKESGVNIKTEEQSISIDLIANYLLNHKAKLLVDTIEMFHSSLKLNNSSWNEGEIGFEDMSHAAKVVFPNKSESWLSSCYRLMINTPQIKGLSLGRMLENSMPVLAKLDRSRTSFKKYI